MPPTKKAKKVSKPRASNPAFMAPQQPDALLAVIVGDQPIPRTEITKRLWDYIKKNDLQDAKNRRQINADASLLPLFNGQKSVTMFEMNRLLTAHMAKV